MILLLLCCIIIFSCKMCGNIIDINDINHAWAHECFLHFDKNKFALAFDDENKLYPVTMEECLTAQTQYQQSSLLEHDVNMKAIGDGNNDDMDEQIILAVKGRPPLWDHIRVAAKDRSKLKISQLWMEVSDILGLDVEKVKARWESLRRQYARAHKAKRAYRASGSGTQSIGTLKAAKINFKFYELMSFLSETVEPVPTINSLSSSTSNVQKTIEHYHNVTENPLKKPQENVRGKKRSCEPSDVTNTNFEDKLLDILKENQNKCPDDIKGFLQLLEVNMCKIPEDHRDLVMIKVLTLVRSEVQTFK